MFRLLDPSVRGSYNIWNTTTLFRASWSHDESGSVALERTSRTGGERVSNCLFGPVNRTVVLAGLCLTGLLTGCSTAPSYPVELRYPARSDVLIRQGPSLEVRHLPPPGKLGETIAAAASLEGARAYDPAKLSDADREELSATLVEVFGTPALPTVKPADAKSEAFKLFDDYFKEMKEQLDISDEAVTALRLEPETLQRGSELYRKHCLHCHGLAGDGRGPTAPWVSPHPRDYRKGEFKYISTHIELIEQNNKKPRRADLLLVLEKGLEGTSMPAFNLLPQEERDALASYVIHLSLRGQVEFDTIEMALVNRDELTDGSVRKHALSTAARLLLQYAQASAREPTPPPPYPYKDADKGELAASIERGHQLFLGKGGCISCHSDYGRQAALRYDNWGTLVKPRDLTQPIYRGGRRPLDLYWRLAGGIVPSNMPALGKIAESEDEQKAGKMTASEYWDLLNFLQALPYPAMMPTELRDKIYRVDEPRAAPGKSVALSGSQE